MYIHKTTIQPFQYTLFSPYKICMNLWLTIITRHCRPVGTDHTMYSSVCKQNKSYTLPHAAQPQINYYLPLIATGECCSTHYAFVFASESHNITVENSQRRLPISIDSMLWILTVLCHLTDVVWSISSVQKFTKILGLRKRLITRSIINNL